MNASQFRSAIARSIGFCVREDRVESFERRMGPFIQHYGDLREQNAYLLRVLRDRSCEPYVPTLPLPDVLPH